VLFLQPGLLAQGGESAAAASGPPPEEPAAAPQQSPASTQVLHIVVGRSVIINLQSRLKRVLVSNPAVVDSLTTSPTQVVVTAKAAGTSSIILWDESGESRILDIYSDVDVSGLRDALDQAFATESVQVTSDQGRVMISGVVRNKAVADDIAKMALAYNKDVVNSLTISGRHPRQIMLKVRFAEVDRAKLTEYGVNIFSTGLGHTPFVTSTQQFGPITGSGGSGSGAQLPGSVATLTVSDLMNIFVFNPDIDLGATIKALQSTNVLEILAEPNLMAVDGQPATFQAGGEFPYPVPQAGVGGAGVITIQFKPFGVRLGFTANIMSDDVIHLKVAPEVSTLDFANALRISGFVVPALSTRTAETEIELKSGQSFGIAGMMDNRTTVLMSKIPGIGDIPILGYLFRSKSTNLANTELMVLVTPVIVDPVNQVEEPPPLPDMPIPFLDVPKFDTSVNKEKKAAPEQQPK
jgi:pilus assembly protein CpaC